MLTIPREKRLKKMVKVSAPGRVIVGADLSQAELRVMALESHDEWLISAFQPGAGDFFDLLLAQAYPERDWFELHARQADHDDPGNFYTDKRAAMKGVVYGKSFGRGDKAIAAALKITLREAQRLSEAFIRPGSAFAMWREEIEFRALNGLDIVSPFGRHFQSELVTRANRQSVINSALSFTSQTTANDICLSAALALDPQLAQYDAWLLGTIHDAIYPEAPEEHAEAVGELTAKCLREAGRAVYGDLVPFDSDWGSGKNLAEI
jgi:DNA polymerase I-like protein with 3'-5' exonuclease and polymerase domains